jgi:hypothetical protein
MIADVSMWRQRVRGSQARQHSSEEEWLLLEQQKKKEINCWPAVVTKSIAVGRLGAVVSR